MGPITPTHQGRTNIADDENGKGRDGDDLWEEEDTGTGGNQDVGCSVEPDLIDLQFVISHHRFEIPKQDVSNPTLFVAQNIDDHE